jgi:TorA maturation chaperone TorD
MTNADLSAGESLIARGRAYALLGAMWRHGMTPETAAFLAGLPEFADAIPSTFDADRAAADHYALLGLTLFPFASAFLSPDGRVGGDVSAQVAAAYASFGYAATGQDAPDHVGIQLDALAFLVGAEADAAADDLPATAQRMRVLQQDFLAAHLLPWLQPFLIAAEEARQPFYGALADLTRRVVAEHMSTLDVPSTPAPRDVVAPDPAAPETTLRALVDFMSTPSRAGIFISRADLQTLTRTHNTPAGFGDRRQLLMNLLRTAAAYDLAPALLVGLQELVARWHTRYVHAQPADIATAYNELSRPWLARIETTRALVAQMVHLAQTSALDLSDDDAQR